MLVIFYPCWCYYKWEIVEKLGAPLLIWTNLCQRDEQFGENNIFKIFTTWHMFLLDFAQSVPEEGAIYFFSFSYMGRKPS